MKEELPEPLWREVVGDTEPWRRGRNFLIGFALLQLVVQLWFTITALLAGNLEGTVGFSLGALFFWLSFYFIWIGVHWVRWLAGAIAALLGFAKLIWGIRDGYPLYLLDGAIGFGLGCYLALAPAVYFFALRQKEHVRWKEAVAVAAVFLVLFASLTVAVLGISAYKVQVEQGAREFAARAFEQIFVEGDIVWLRHHATQRLLHAESWERLSAFMNDRAQHIAPAHDLTRPDGRVAFTYRLPFALTASGTMSCDAQVEQRSMYLEVMLVNAGNGWQVDRIAYH